jgi:hypothetical protein
MRRRVELLRLRSKILVGVAFATGVGGAGGLVVHRSSAGQGSVPSALERPRSVDDVLPPVVAAVVSHLGFRTSESRRVAPMTFLVPREPGRLCVLSIFRNELPYGCGDASGLFGDEQTVTSVVEDGRPGAPTRLRVFGVARSEVRALRIVFPGVSRTVTTSGDHGFSFDADSTALAAGDPVRVDALDAKGDVLRAQPLSEKP